jgi:UDP-N-acetylmuramoylalanine--D-glutamate ligase
MKKELKFKGKKVLIFGLGLLGGGIEAAKWFYKNGAKLIITDKKTKKELLPSIKRLKKIKAKYILGEHRFEDIDSSDIIYFNPGVSYKSEWVNYAKEKEKEVANDCYLFFKYAKGDVIAITGTRGKTTTTTWIYELLTQIYPDTRTISDYTQTNTDLITKEDKKSQNVRTIRVESEKVRRSEPLVLSPKKSVLLGGNQPEKSLFKILDKTKEDSISVLEISCFQLEFYPTADERGFVKAPKIAIITNIYNDHLNRYSSFEEYASVKARIFLNQTENDYLILNLDNDWTNFFLRLKPKSQVYFVSLRGPIRNKHGHFGQVKVKGGIYIKDEKIFIEDENNDCLRKSALSMPVSTFKEIYGKHNFYNLLFAILAVYLYFKSKNIRNPQDKIKKLKNFILNLKTPEFRQEIVYKDKNLMIVNDSAATSPDATINAIERFKKYICPKKSAMYRLFRTLHGLNGLYGQEKQKRGPNRQCLVRTGPSEAQKSLGDLILITGGTDKNLDFKDLAKKIKKEIKPKNLILLNGSATKKLIEELRKIKYPLIEENIFEDLREAVYRGLTLILTQINADKNIRDHQRDKNPRKSALYPRLSVVLFSPASASFEKFKNEFDRGKKFNKIIKIYMLK